VLIKILLYISDRREQAVQHIEKQEEEVKKREEVEDIDKLKKREEVEDIDKLEER